MYIPHIGDQLRDYRLKSSLSQISVCNKIFELTGKKLTQAGLSKIESSCNFPRAVMFYTLLNIYKAGIATYEVVDYRPPYNLDLIDNLIIMNEFKQVYIFE